MGEYECFFYVDIIHHNNQYTVLHYTRSQKFGLTSNTPKVKYVFSQEIISHIGAFVAEKLNKDKTTESLIQLMSHKKKKKKKTHCKEITIFD